MSIGFNFTNIDTSLIKTGFTKPVLINEVYKVNGGTYKHRRRLPKLLSFLVPSP